MKKIFFQVMVNAITTRSRTNPTHLYSYWDRGKGLVATICWTVFKWSSSRGDRRN